MDSKQNNNIILKLMTGSNKYANKELKESLKLESQNERFIEMLKSNGITTVNITSLGNSIATGYSVNSIIKPLLKRNETLENITRLMSKHKKVMNKKRLKTIKNYYKEKYPHDYFYTQKKDVEKIIDENISRLK